jgi:hypothetical protein
MIKKKVIVESQEAQIIQKAEVFMFGLYRTWILLGHGHICV